MLQMVSGEGVPCGGGGGGGVGKGRVGQSGAYNYIMLCMYVMFSKRYPLSWATYAVNKGG